MRKEKVYVYLTTEETSVLLQSLIRLKNALLQQGRYSDCVDEVILKVMDAPVCKIKTT